MRLAALALLLVLVAGCSRTTTEPAAVVQPIGFYDPPAEVDREPSWSPSGTAIVYVHSAYQVRILDLVSRATSDIGTGWHPRWSPNGARIAYAGDGGIHLHDVKTGTDSLLTDTGYWPAWSWDSQWLAFMSATSTGPEVWMMHLASGTKFRVEGKVSQPCWMPGDSAMVVIAGFTDGGAEVAIVDLRTWVRSEPTRLTHDGSDNREPVVSPDGSRVAWFGLPRHSGDPFGVFSIPTTGGERVLLAANGHDPAWSPDGTRIAYTGYNSDSYSYSLWLMQSDGSGKVQLTAP
jgi:Tol biopolymer transport system component